MKILIIRLSSFGDISQCLPVVPELLSDFPSAEIHWLARGDFLDFTRGVRGIKKVWSVRPKSGLREIIKTYNELKYENYTHIYDAHSNLRSHILCLLLRVRGFVKKSKPRLIRRPKNRFKRFLLFKLRVDQFPLPFRGTQSYRTPLKPWLKTQLGPPYEVRLNDRFALKNAELIKHLGRTILLAPSAAWPLKRWPVEYWKSLIKFLPEKKFVLLGGPEDHFLSEIEAAAPQRVKNMAGQASWAETAQLIQHSQLVISNDTGTLHLADVLGKKTIGLIGPTAFGHTSYKNSVVLETKLYCKPCTKDGRGKCRNKVYLKCMYDVTPNLVACKAKELTSR